MSAATETETATAARLGIQSVAPIGYGTKEGSPYALVFHNGTIKNMEAYGDQPRRKRAQVDLYEAKSFIDYVKMFAIPYRTLISGNADEKGGAFAAIIDYHASNSEVATNNVAGWGEHVVRLNLVTTPEWKRWVAKNEQMMTQADFCEFIEDNMLDIVEPAGADMLEMAQLISGTKGVVFKSGKNLKNGAIDFAYTEEIAAASRRDGSMQIPSSFTLELTPFVGAMGVKITVRLRFHISSSGQLSFKYLLNRPEKVIENAFNATRDQIEAGTKLGVLLGGAQVRNPSPQ